MRKLLCFALLAVALPAGAAWPDQFSIYGIGAKSAPNKHGQVDLQSLNFEFSGPIYASKRVPESTSHFNFHSQGGAGVITPRGWMLGVRAGHISNAGYAERNPGINFTEVLFGYRLR